MQTMVDSPDRQAAAAFAATIGSVSPWCRRRSEWPTITAAAPASLSIPALTSPVNGPEASAWQSSPPSTIRPAAVCTARDSKVAGTQISTSAAGGLA